MKAAVLSAGAAGIPSADDSDCGFQIVDGGFVIDMMTLPEELVEDVANA